MDLDSGQHAAIRGAGRRIAAGLVAAPMFDVADDRGLIGGIARFDLDVLRGAGISAWLWLLFFGGLAAAFAHLFPTHRPRARAVFVIAGAVPVSAYWVIGGLRLSVLMAVLLLALGLVSWSVAGFDAEPAP